jgi:hypothetical protein
MPRRVRLRAELILALVLLPAPAAAQQVAPPSATWSITGTPGAIVSLAARMRDGSRIVADRFVRDARLARDEQGQFAQTPNRRGGCAWASAARPFTRLRRYAASGRLLWEWRVYREQQALRLAAVGTADCLSPGGTRLTVVSYRLAPDEPVSAMSGYGVVAVDRRPRFVDVPEINVRDADITGWLRGAPATLLFGISDETGRTTARQVVVR